MLARFRSKRALQRGLAAVAAGDLAAAFSALQDAYRLSTSLKDQAAAAAALSALLCDVPEERASRFGRELRLITFMQGFCLGCLPEGEVAAIGSDLRQRFEDLADKDDLELAVLGWLADAGVHLGRGDLQEFATAVQGATGMLAKHLGPDSEPAAQVLEEAGDRLLFAGAAAAAGQFFAASRRMRALHVERAAPGTPEHGERSLRLARLSERAGLAALREQAPDTAVPLLEEAVALFDAHGDLAARVRSRQNLAQLLTHAGRPADAVAAVDEALALLEVRHTLEAAQLLGARGSALRWADRLAEAVADYEEALAILEQLGVEGHQAAGLWSNASNAFEEHGLTERALELRARAEEAVQAAVEAGEATALA